MSLNTTPDDTLDLDLRLANRQARTKFFVGRAMRQSRLPKPITHLNPRGLYVPPPHPLSRSAVVKLWTTKATTTAAHSRYLTRGKGQDGTDARLFGPDGQPMDRHAFASRAQDDPHQLRFIIALVPPVVLDWIAFTQRFLQQMSHDVRSWLDALCAVHEDRPVRHVHVQLRARTDDGQPLYLTKDYWTTGLRFRAQQIATEFLGRLSPAQVVREQRMLPQVAAEISDVKFARQRTLSRDEVTTRLSDTQARVEAFKTRVQRIQQRHAERHGHQHGGPE